MKSGYVVLMLVIASVLQADCTTLLNQELRKADCEELVQCRDTQLLQALDSAFKEHEKWLNIYEVNKGVLEDVEALKGEVSRKKAIEHIVRSINILANITGAALSGAPVNSKTTQIILQGIDYAEIAISEDAPKTVVLQQLGKHIISAQLVVLNDLYELKEAHSGYNQILDRLGSDIHSQNEKVKRYKELLNNSHDSMGGINKEKNRIDAFCSSY